MRRCGGSQSSPFQHRILKRRLVFAFDIAVLVFTYVLLGGTGAVASHLRLMICVLRFTLGIFAV